MYPPFLYAGEKSVSPCIYICARWDGHGRVNVYRTRLSLSLPPSPVAKPSCSWSYLPPLTLTGNEAGGGGGGGRGVRVLG